MASAAAPGVETSLQTFAGALAQWVLKHSLGRKPSTQKFNREIAATVTRQWPDLSLTAGAVGPDDVLAFGQRVAHYCPARWNAMVSALRFITPHGRLLDFRAVQMRQFTPPAQEQFLTLLAECDRSPRSKAGLFVRFLSLTGLRIAEARGLTWSNVLPDRIVVPAEVAKSGRSRCIPLLEGLQEVLARLRALDSGAHILPREDARKAIVSACVRAGVPRMTHHHFRHYFATRCIESGVDVPTVARWLGHQDGGALLSKTYFHLLDDHSRRMAERVKIAA